MLATLVAAFLSTAAPEPLDPDLACIVDRVPAAARAVILTETASEADGPAQAALIDAATACQAELSVKRFAMYPRSVVGPPRLGRS